MSEAVSISKSVARAFRVLELFQAERQRLTAAGIGRRLALPQPSTRALLKTLVGLGYLDYSPDDRSYWPTPRVTGLGQWLASAEQLPAWLTAAADRIGEQAGETTSLCALRNGHVVILHVHKARHPVALQLEPGIGAAAWRTAVGRSLLAALPGDQSAGLLEGWLRRERSAASRRVLKALPRELARARTDGYLAGYDLYLAGAGAVCVPVPRDGPGLEAPLVVAVAGLSGRIRRRETALLRLMRAEMRRTR